MSLATMAKDRLARSQQALGAMRYPEYRKYWFASLAAVSGFQMAMFGQLWLIRQLEENPIWLGAVGVASGLPAIVLTLFGGVVADRFDQRRLIIITQALSGSLVFLLAVLAFLHVVEVWHVLAIAFGSGAIGAFNMPAQQAIFTRLIDRKDLMNAVALNSAIWQGTRMVAPMVAGLVIAASGTEAALFLACVGYLGMAVLMLRLKVPPAPRAQRGNALQELFQGARFVRDNALFASLIAMTFFNSFFGMAYLQLMPVFTIDILQKGAAIQGALLSAGGVGALLGTGVATFLGRFSRLGWLILGGSTLFGGFVVAFALSHWYAVSLAALFFAGFAQSIYMISIMTTLQMKVPDHLRGRVMGIYGMTYNLMPLGGMLAGGVASAVSAPFAVAFGGAAVSGFAFLNGAFNRHVQGLRREVSPAVPTRAGAPSG